MFGVLFACMKHATRCDTHDLVAKDRDQRHHQPSTVFGRQFVKRFALCYQTVVCLSILSVYDVGVLWPNGWMDQDETWHGGMPWPRRHCVTWGPSFPSPKGAQPPIFSPCLLWPNG